MNEQKKPQKGRTNKIKQYMHLRVKWMIDFRIKTFKFDDIHKQGSTLNIYLDFLYIIFNN